MIKIGILGDDNLSEVSEMIQSLCKNVNSEKNILVECLPKEIRPSGIYNILIVNSPCQSITDYDSHINKNSILIINSDHKGINRLLKNIKCRILSYGLNSKACMTASSVVENHYRTVLCCIQRRLPTFSGDTILQQEFSVDVPNTSNVHGVLSSVTTALIMGVPISKISKINI